MTFGAPTLYALHVGRSFERRLKQIEEMPISEADKRILRRVANLGSFWSVAWPMLAGFPLLFLMFWWPTAAFVVVIGLAVAFYWYVRKRLADRKNEKLQE